MISGQNMITNTEMICQTSLPVVVDMQYRLCVAKEADFNVDMESPSTPTFQSVMNNSSDSIEDAKLYTPIIRSGSYSDIGSRASMEDEHICIDDLSPHLGSLINSSMPSAFYAVFDGHGGPEAAAYVKRNALKFFFEDIDLPKTSDIDQFLEALVYSHQKAFLLADLALAEESSVSSWCGTTAITAIVIGNHLLVANAGDCRAVICRKGKAVDLSQDHRPSYLPERKRVENSGGYIDDEYVNGCLAVTRALGDWELKLPIGSTSPVISEPDVRQIILTDDDQFLIIGCDGIWDVMSSQSAISLVSRALKRHGNPEECAKELVKEALRLNSTDNLTAVVILFSSSNHAKNSSSQPQRSSSCCRLSEEALNKLKRFLEGN